MRHVMSETHPEATQPDAVVTEAPKPAKASGRGWLIAGLVVAALAAIGFGVFSAYLWSVHSQYVAQNEELREIADGLGTDVAERQASLESLQAELDDTAAQLQVAKDTINGLANSEAQAGDDRQALVDVAEGLQECADARQDLIDHLNEAHLWTAESLRATENSITEYCDKVEKAYDEVVNG
jgi:uncharacterized protein HemX